MNILHVLLSRRFGPTTVGELSTHLWTSGPLSLWPDNVKVLAEDGYIAVTVTCVSRFFLSSLCSGRGASRVGGL